MATHHRLAACALLVLVATASPHANHPLTEFAAEVLEGSLVLVPVSVNGRPLLLLIDTGATTTLLDSDTAATLDLRASGALHLVTAAGELRAPTGLVSGLAIGDIHVPRLRVAWTPLREMRAIDRRIAGVIGQDVLRGFTVTLDYRRRTARLDAAPCASGDTRVPLDWTEGRPTVRARFATAGLPAEARVVLDSAATSLILFHDSRDPARAAPVSTHGAAARAALVSAVPVEIGGLRLLGPAALLSPATARVETGLMPTAWFSRVCLDGPRQTATLTR